MKKHQDLIEANIDNLTAFWETAVLPFQAYNETPYYRSSVISGSEWPNRIWLTREKLAENDLKIAIEKLKSSTTPLTLPYWDIYEQDFSGLIESQGCQLRFEQTGMSLRLDSPFEEPRHLQFERITNEQKARKWADLYPRAFGYTISSDILIETMEQIHFYLASFNSQPVGTAILYKTGEIAGIHGVGIFPEMRKRGYATEMMKFILNRAIGLNAEYATLQASQMGKGIYLRLGFEEQFLIKNFVYQAD